MVLLETRDLKAFYGDFQALFGINIAIEEGETIAIIGSNGAGKTTLMRAITGILPSVPNSIMFEGAPIGALTSPDIVGLGIAMVPEGRLLFPSLSVEENLLIGRRGRKVDGPWNLNSIYDLFPILKERRKSGGTALSGGQQQMVAIGRALMSNPRVLLCDEISLGLAPIVINEIYAAFSRIKATGSSIVIVEQDIGKALSVASRVYCMMEGRISLEGKSQELSREDIHNAYFGVKA
jgi:branched-chain amino acid transport system ATP-binding protein